MHKAILFGTYYVLIIAIMRRVHETLIVKIHLTSQGCPVDSVKSSLGRVRNSNRLYTRGILPYFTSQTHIKIITACGCDVGWTEHLLYYTV